MYIWTSDDMGKYNDKRLYKIGITSSRLGDDRIHRVAAKKGMKANIVAFMKVSGIKATSLEKTILSMGDDPELRGFDGATEIRAMTNDDIKNAINLMAEYAIEDLYTHSEECA